jgi:hypothetical protein
LQVDTDHLIEDLDQTKRIGELNHFKFLKILAAHDKTAAAPLKGEGAGGLLSRW